MDSAVPLPRPALEARARYAPVLIVALMLVCGILSYLTYGWSQRAGYGAIAGVASHQLDLYSASLDRELRRHEYLPSYLELDLDVNALLRNPTNPELRRKVSEALGKLSVRASTTSIFLLDPKGTVIAASNWQPESLVGTDYSHRRIYRDALKGGLVGYFSGVADSPEFYLAETIRANGATLGVAVVKVGLEGLETNWLASGSHSRTSKFLVVDENDVVILASEPSWKFRTIASVGAEHRAELQALGKYPQRTTALQVLGWDFQKTLGGSLLVLGVTDSDSNESGNTTFVAHEKTMVAPPWRFIVLSEASSVTRHARNTAAAVGLAAALAGLLGVFLLQRQRNVQLRLQASEALHMAQYEMASRVKEHNEELQRANAELRHEVVERQRAEAVLREAQDGLVQAGKLALLGQMSAGITHEINQPLTALRNLSDNAKRLLELGRLEEVRGNIEAITELTSRIGRLTKQLKTFARKAPRTIQPTLIGQSVGNALLLLDSRIKAECIEVQLDTPEELRAACDCNRLEQVLVNLFANALDAMREAPHHRILAVRVWAAEGRVLVRVTDNGHGIPDHALPHLFEPFFSTKPPGEGLGLGLVISAQIVREFGGTLRAINNRDGTAFEFDLTLVEEMSHV